MPKQENGQREGSVIQNDLSESFEEEIGAFLGDEEKLHLFDDLTKVNPVTTRTVLKCLQARYRANLFYTNAGCSLVALNPFQPFSCLYSPELMREYHVALCPQITKGATAEERLEWNLPEGAEYRWLPNAERN